MLMTNEQAIVEDSRRDKFWGAIATKQDPNILVCCNVLGRLLMELREEVRNASSKEWQKLEPPRIADFLLFDRPIGIVYKTDALGSRDRQMQFQVGGDPHE